MNIASKIALDLVGFFFGFFAIVCGTLAEQNKINARVSVGHIIGGMVLVIISGVMFSIGATL